MGTQLELDPIMILVMNNKKYVLDGVHCFVILFGKAMGHQEASLY